MRALIGTCAWVFLHGLGLMLAINFTGFLKIIGYIDYIGTSMLFYFILLQYFKSDFYKNLGKEK